MRWRRIARTAGLILLALLGCVLGLSYWQCIAGTVIVR